uniref:Uncharacterized protein n=1 Tax=Rhizophagus irregularis (strain DAOM 181602 / DAOM 197198 / MUCL 43194) TaxID=747089 RepID=U9T5T7_RHIID
MHESNLLELLPSELISFILKYLPDLKHASGINDIWEREVNLEQPKKVNLRIILNDGEKHKIIPTEFIVTGPDWPDQFPEILLGSPWMRENSVRLNMCVINLPELLEWILYFLAVDKFFYPALFVSRLWYRCGAPILWKRIELRGKDLYPGQSLPNDYKNYCAKDKKI